MPAAARGTDWTILIAGAALIITFGSGLWSLVNPQKDTERMEKRLSAVESDLTWKYVNRDLLAKDIASLQRDLLDLKSSKVDKDVYDLRSQMVDRSLTIQRGRIVELDKSVNQTYSAKDVLQAMQIRLGDLEKALRDKPK